VGGGRGWHALPGRRPVRDVQRCNLAELINFFNDGELIHDGPHSEEYHKLAEDPELAVIEQTPTL
jgi:hypothetical protein